MEHALGTRGSNHWYTAGHVVLQVTRSIPLPTVVQRPPHTPSCYLPCNMAAGLARLPPFQLVVCAPGAGHECSWVTPWLSLHGSQWVDFLCAVDLG